MPARPVEILAGYHALRQALARRPHDVLEVYVAPDRKPSPKLDALLTACEQASISVQPVSRLKLDRLTGMKKHQGLAARCRQAGLRQPLTLAELCAEPLNETSIVLALDRVMDPHNLGACIRTADAVGVDAIVLPRAHSAPLNAGARKAASGAADTVNIITVANLARSLRQLHASGYLILGAHGAADNSIYETRITFPVVLVVGSEHNGLRHNTREHCDCLVGIPMYGSVESLNLSVAAGVCLYEIKRRMNQDKD